MIVTMAQNAGAAWEIACDESGHEGENLVRANSDVFAHASVLMNAESAANCIREVRRNIRSRAVEYKASRLLRERHRPVLGWLLGPHGPVHGAARVHLTDKCFFVVDRVLDLLLGPAAYDFGLGPRPDSHTRAMATVLYRAGRVAVHHREWQAFLESSNDLMRSGGDRRDDPVEPFFRTVEALRLGASDSGNGSGSGSGSGEILTRLERSRDRAAAFRAGLAADPSAALDPLLPALVSAVRYWGRDGVPVRVVHDQQSALTRARTERLRGALDGSARLGELRLVDSRADPRVQVADFLAGAARKIASDELNGRGDAQLTGLLRPYVDPASVWGDDRSWSRLR